MDDWTTEEREAWWQAFNQSVHDWQLWEQWWATEGERHGVEPKRRHKFKHYLEFEYGRALAREKLTDGETETYIDRAINEQRGHNQWVKNWLHELQDTLATTPSANRIPWWPIAWSVMVLIVLVIFAVLLGHRK